MASRFSFESVAARAVFICLATTLGFNTCFEVCLCDRHRFDECRSVAARYRFKKFEAFLKFGGERAAPSRRIESPHNSIQYETWVGSFLEKLSGERCPFVWFALF